jgi:hypothetical protein
MYCMYSTQHGTAGSILYIIWSQNTALPPAPAPSENNIFPLFSPSRDIPVFTPHKPFFHYSLAVLHTLYHFPFPFHFPFISLFFFSLTFSIVTPPFFSVHVFLILVDFPLGEKGGGGKIIYPVIPLNVLIALYIARSQILRIKSKLVF